MTDDKRNLIMFATGTTGYIGGSVFNRIMKDGYKEIRVLVRTNDQAEIMKKCGANITPVIGSLQDSDLLEREAKNANIVLSMADADHLPSVQAMLKGSNERNPQETSVFLHTSGTGLLTWAKKPYTNEEAYDDNSVDDIQKRIPISAPHKTIDQHIFDNCSNNKGLRVAIIAPSTIYGIGSGPIKRNSVQVMHLALAAVARKKAGFINPNGFTTQWDNVHIDDLTNLYSLVLDGLLNKSNPIDHGINGFYFGIAANHTWGAVAQRLAIELKKRGLVDTEEISEFEPEYVKKYFWDDRTQWNDSRGKANRSKKIGWSPSPPRSIYDEIPIELDYLIKIDYFNKNM